MTERCLHCRRPATRYACEQAQDDPVCDRCLAKLYLACDVCGDSVPLTTVVVHLTKRSRAHEFVVCCEACADGHTRPKLIRRVDRVARP
jgi:hypothetical protein